MRYLKLAPILAALASALAAEPAQSQSQAQRVAVRVLSAESAAPVVGAVVHLIGATGSTVDRGLTNAEGRALLLDLPAGRYRLRAEMIGMASLESEAFDVAPGATVQRELRLETRPIDVRGVEVAVGERCRVRAGDGAAVQRIWDEARKALEATALTDERRAYRYRTMMYERDLEADARTVTGEERTRRVATLRSPFKSRPAAELVEEGFVEGDAQGDLYFAPDAAVLLSDPFLDSHCFRLTRGEADETSGLVGLAFEPLDSRRVADVSGTLWIDPATSELRWLDYRYENIDPDIRTEHVGGRVEFRRMPDGGWIVPEWFIRMPSVAVQREVRTGRSRIYVAGYRQVGGMVLDVDGVGAGPGPESRTGTLAGEVTGDVGAGLQGVSVEVVGTGHAARTDGEGRYRIEGLVPGDYRVRVNDARLRAFGYQPQPVTITVAAGETAEVDVRVPSADTVLSATCSATEPEVDPAEVPIQAFGEGVLAGRVVDAATGRPLPGAEVRVVAHRYEFARGTQPRGPLPVYSDAGVGKLPDYETRITIYDERYGLLTRADDEGYYRVCWVPEAELLTVVGAYEGLVTGGDTLKIGEPGGVREHTIRIPGGR